MFQKPENPLDKMTPEQRKLLEADEIAELQAIYEWHVAVVDLGELNQLLHADLVEIARIAAQDNPKSHWYKRSLFRNLFAWIEGYINGLKPISLRIYEARIYEGFTAGELALLSEQTYNLDNQGNVSSVDKYPKTEQNILFAFAMFARVHDLKIRIDKGGEDWDSFMKVLKVRNRLTHPKSAIKLNVTDDELEALMRVATWFGELATTTGKGAIAFVENLRKTRAMERERRQREYLDIAQHRVAQVATIERAENILRHFAEADNKTVVSRDEVIKLAEELNLLKKEIAQNLLGKS